LSYSEQSLCSSKPTQAIEVNAIMNALSKTLFIITLPLLAAACASNVARDIASAPAHDLSIAEARTDIIGHVGASVRWGGTIISIENDDDLARVEILSRPLNRGGRPSEEDRSFGRFIATFDGFLDPAIYFEGRDITVFGTIDGQIDGQIGKRPYIYPVVHVSQHQLWRNFSNTNVPPAMPGYRHNFYGPAYYPWGYYPWGWYQRPPMMRPDPTPRRPSALR
jgi:outer membrane lipoprotein